MIPVNELKRIQENYNRVAYQLDQIVEIMEDCGVADYICADVTHWYYHEEHNTIYFEREYKDPYEDIMDQFDCHTINADMLSWSSEELIEEFENQYDTLMDETTSFELDTLKRQAKHLGYRLVEVT